MYIIVLILILFGTILELFFKKELKLYFYFVIGILAFMLLFRYGQGTDYFGYKYLFLVTPTKFSDTFAVYQNYHGEIGWFILMTLFKKIGLNFVHFVFASALFTFSFLYQPIKKSPYKFMTLLLLYPTYYLTYCFSAIRQGIILSVFLGLLLPSIVENKRKLLYYIICILLCTIHKTAFVFLMLPSILYIIKKLTKNQLYLISLICIFLVNIALIINNSYNFISLSNYLKINVSILAILIRIFYFIIASIFHNINKKCKNKTENILYYLYSFGFVLYLSLVSLATLSQRITMPLKALEIILIPVEIKLFIEAKQKSTFFLGKKLKNNIIFVFFSVFFCITAIVETAKNINSYINQGNYYHNVNIFNYPYVSYFNKEDIYENRETSNYDILLNEE